MPSTHHHHLVATEQIPPQQNLRLHHWSWSVSAGPSEEGGKAFPSELLSPSLHPRPPTLFKNLSKSLVPLFKNQTKTNHFLNIQQSIFCFKMLDLLFGRVSFCWKYLVIQWYSVHIGKSWSCLKTDFNLFSQTLFFLLYPRKLRLFILNDRWSSTSNLIVDVSSKLVNHCWNKWKVSKDYFSAWYFVNVIIQHCFTFLGNTFLDRKTG